MTGRRTAAVFAFLALALLTAAGVNVGKVTFADVRQTMDQAYGALPATVISRVIDGDTVELVDGTRVRYIGIDTPELGSGRTAPDCLAQEAKKANASMVEGKTVALEYDVTRQDKYGRDLAYVWLDGEMVNERLIKEGYASVLTIPPNVKYTSRFQADERAARQAEVGLWRPGACSS